MARVIWKGAISFGLVHVPVALYPASREADVDFDWLDRRSMDPVGYKRINKRTGREIDKDNVVRGVKVGDGDYVVLSDEEIAAAYPKSTQTIEIEAFVPATEIPFLHLERPYLEPLGRAAKVYALLRDALAGAGVFGIARLVMHSKEHLAALIPAGPALMLDTLRWGAEIRPWDELQLPPLGGDARSPAAELKMARQLIDEMTVSWDATAYEDRFAKAVMDLVERKHAAGQSKAVRPVEQEAPAATNIVDLSALLRRSLEQRRGEASAPKARKTARKRA